MATSSLLSASPSRDVYELLNADLGVSESRGPLYIHTARASLVLDENGICRDAFTLDGTDLTRAERCIGAQYIACIDESGVTGKPAVGAHALLIHRNGSALPAVIKTAAITSLIYADDIVEA